MTPANPVSEALAANSVGFSRCCYINNIGAFLAGEEHNWLDSMQKSFTRIMSLPLGESQVRAWKDCFCVLKNELPAIAARLVRLGIIENRDVFRKRRV